MLPRPNASSARAAVLCGNDRSKIAAGRTESAEDIVAGVACVGIDPGVFACRVAVSPTLADHALFVCCRSDGAVLHRAQSLVAMLCGELQSVVGFRSSDAVVSAVISVRAERAIQQQNSGDDAAFHIKSSIWSKRSQMWVAKLGAIGSSDFGYKSDMSV
jgi:hypothetical protein